MKRARVVRFGEPAEVVSLFDLPLGEPKADEALVAVVASPVNPADLLRIRGLYGYGESAPVLPFWAGIEGVGRVEAVGEDVSNVVVGDLVTLARVAGIWGEKLNAKADGLVVLPADADPLQAAMIVVNPPTAECMLTDYVDLAEGDWVIQNAANSAVGKHVIRLAAAKGLRTLNVVRREGLEEALSDLGADAVLVDGDDLAERVAETTGGTLPKLAIDAVGGEATGRLAHCLPFGGTVVVYGLLSGEDSRVPVAPVVFNDIRIRGFLLPHALASRTPQEVQALYARLTALVLDGTLAVPIEAIYPLSELPDALQHAERGGRGGKIIIKP